MAEYLARIELEAVDATLCAFRVWRGSDDDAPAIWFQIDLGPIRWSVEFALAVYLCAGVERSAASSHAGAWAGAGPIWTRIEWRHGCWATGRCEKQAASDAGAGGDDG